MVEAALNSTQLLGNTIKLLLDLTTSLDLRTVWTLPTIIGFGFMRCVGIVGIIRGGGRARYFGHQLYLGGVYDGVSVEEGALEGGIHKQM